MTASQTRADRIMRKRMREWGAIGGKAGSREEKRKAANAAWAPGGALRTRTDNARPKGFTCICGKSLAFPQFIFDDWSGRHIYDCECGRQYTICRGKGILRKVKVK